MPEQYRVELNLPDESLFVMPADLRAGPANTHMQLPVPSWAASYSASPRRPFTAADAPSSPASSTASQKFEVKRLLSRPADLAPSPRPLTTFDLSPSPSLAGPSSGVTVKRSNSAGRSLLKRRPSKGHTDSSPAPAPAPTPAPIGPRQRTTTAPALLSHSRPNPYSSSLHPMDTPSRESVLPPVPYTPNSIASAPAPARSFPSSPGIAPSPASSSSTLTPASAYALAYAQRTRMTVEEQEKSRVGRGRDRESDESRSQTRGTSTTPTPTRSPFEGVGTGRLVALGDPTDESLSLTLSSTIPGLALAGFGVAAVPGEPVLASGSGPKGEGMLGLTRKVSAKFGRRKASRAVRPSGMDVQSDEEQEVSWKEWNQEKEKAGLRGIGLTPVPTTVRLGEKIMSGEKLREKARKRVSRHLSIEEFRGNTRVESEMGTRFEMWDPRPTEEKREQDKREEERSAAMKSERKGNLESETRSKEKETGRRERKYSVTQGRTEISRATKVENVGFGGQLGNGKEDSRQRDVHHSSSLPLCRHPSVSRKDDARPNQTESRPDVALRSNSAPGHGYPVTEAPRQTGTVSPESHKSGGGILWRLVKKMSTGTLKEKRYFNPEKAPPVPRLPATLPSSRRSSVIDDYGEEVRPELSRFGASRSASGHIGSDPGGAHSGSGSTHSGPSIFGTYAGTLPIGPQTQAHSTQQQHGHRSASGGRPSLTNDWRPSLTNESSVVSSSPKSSFGRTQSPRTSMSSYIDVTDDVSPPPLPLPLVGKHIVAPCDLVQYTPSLSMSPHHTTPHPSVMHREREQPTGSQSLPPPKRPARATQKPREKPASGPASPPAPTSVPIITAPPLSPTSLKTKPRPNVLRRPTRLGDDKPGSVSPRSPRSASMGLPSPRGRPPVGARTAEAEDSAPGESSKRIRRPRSSSLGTVFTFREIDGGKGKPKEKLTEQEKVAKFEQLLEASDKAGGTLHAKLQDKLLSDTMRLSENYGSEAGGM